MTGQSLGNTNSGVRDGSAWNGDAKAQGTALDALVNRQVPLDEAAHVPDDIRAYVARKLSGVNPLATVPSERLGDSDAAAAERCRRLVVNWAGEAGIDRVRWIMKVDGPMEVDVAAYADEEADGLLRLMALIRHKHRNEPAWDPGTPDEFAARMLTSQAQDLSVSYRTRGLFGPNWKTYGRLGSAAQGKFEGHIMRVVTLSQARRLAQAAAPSRQANDRPGTPTPSAAVPPTARRPLEPTGALAEPPSLADGDQGTMKAWLLADWFVRDFAPVWLSALGPDDPAVVLRGTPELRSLADLPEAQRRIDTVGAMMDGVTGAVAGTTAERDLAADITTSCIGGLTDYTNLVTAQVGEALGSIAYQALKLAGIAGTNYLVAGIHRAPPMFRNDPAKLRAALRQALQPTVDASNAAIQRLGVRLDAPPHHDEAGPAASTHEDASEESDGDGDDAVEIAGRTCDDVIASVKAALTGDFQHDGALITSVGQSCEGHPQAKEIRRELGRMLHAIAPDDVKAKFDQVVEGFEGGFEPGLAEARAKIGASDVAGARAVLEDLVRRYGSGTGLFQDDSVSEYRHFRNDFELALYGELYQPSRKVRKLPQDRATLYSLYGAVLLEVRDAGGAEAALRESLRANPVNTEALFELGEVMKLTGRKRECREITLRAMTVAYAQDMLGRGYRNLGYLAVEDADYDLAVACYAMSLLVDRDHARAAQSELFYIQQVTGGTASLPDPAAVRATLLERGIPVGPSQLVTQLMESSQ
jgi:tetratricopeptide (TPR) repeat protein